MHSSLTENFLHPIIYSCKLCLLICPVLIQASSKEMGARSIRVSFPKIESRRMFPNRRALDWKQRSYVDSPHKVYVGNLAWTVNSRSLGNFFESCTNVLGAKVIYEPQTGKSHGYGFVSFPSKDDANTAIASLNGKDLEGRPVQLRMIRKRTATKEISEN